MYQWLRITFLITFAVFWWREVQYECPLTEDCPRVEYQTMVQDPELFTHENVTRANERCTEVATQREAYMRTQGWNSVALVANAVAPVARTGMRRSPIKAHTRYRYRCQPLLQER